ncbi:MAG: DUF6949 family protein [Propylenella sp.]
MSELGVFAYCAVIGFVAAATIATFYQWVTSERAELFAIKPTVPGVVFAVLLSMFCGPFIVVRRVVTAVRAKEITILPALVGVLIAGMWSVCAGIFYVSLMISA